MFDRFSMKKSSRQLSIIPLEDRTNPAGSINVSVIAGDLIITGDGNPNGNQFTITETAPTSYSVSGQNGTIVNVLATGAVTRDIKITLGSGSDSVTYSGSFNTTLRDVIISPGFGNDTVSFTNFIARNVTVNQPVNSVDSDTTSMNNPTISGNVVVNNQGGADVTTINGRVAGVVAVNSRDGGDTTTVSNRISKSVTITNTTGVAGNAVNISASIGGALTINNPSPAASTVNINGAAISGVTKITNNSGGVTQTTTNLVNSLFSQAVSVTGGLGIDVVNVTGSIFAKTLAISLSNGSGNGVSFNTSTVFGAVSVSAGTGNDSIISNTGANSFRSSVTLSLGSGNNVAEFSGANVSGNFSYTGTGGNDSFRTDIPNTTEVFGGNITFNAGDGTNELVLFGASTNSFTFVGGSINSTTGNGTDTVFLRYIGILGTTTLNMGLGNDSAVIDDSTLFSHFTFNGSSGDDELFIEGNTGGAFTGDVEIIGNFTANFGAGVDLISLGINNDTNTFLSVYGTTAGDFRTAATETRIFTNRIQRIGFLTF